MSRVEVSVPESIVKIIKFPQIYQNYNASGHPTSYGVDLQLPEINLFTTLKSTDLHILRVKIENTLCSWALKYESHLRRQHSMQKEYNVEELNKKAKSDFEQLENILSHTLGIDDAVDWNSLKRNEKYSVNPIYLFEDNNLPTFIHFFENGYPQDVELLDCPPEPQLSEVQSKYGILRNAFKKKGINTEYEQERIKWKCVCEEVESENDQRSSIFNNAKDVWNKLSAEFENVQLRDNQSIDEMKSRYERSDSKAIEEYCDLVLNNSKYPMYFPKSWILEYRSESKIVVVDYNLPAPSNLPTVESCRYIKSRDEISEKHLAKAKQKELFESVIYQICIRTVHELFEADTVNAVEGVVFNGLVTEKNPATGKDEIKTIISISATKEEFLELELAEIEPKAAFRHLKGVSATSLIDLTPVPPIIRLETTDKRFIDAKVVTDQLDESVNLAAMDWEEFEHLIRELFEEEFVSAGGEVKVTQASSDGGVDAIAFDPDPIRGGKIVIQAKRYTNIVGVAAVRDLYGTVMAEGATKGILVTTSDYGKDSYKFAKGKPITLLNGSNLLALLDKHGHKARINIAEAKKLLKDDD